MAPPHYLATLSTDENIAILRFLSYSPRAEQWCEALRPSNFELVFAKNGPFASAMAECHKNVCITYISASVKFGLEHETSTRIWIDRIHAFGRYFEKLKLTDLNNFCPSLDADVRCALAEHCDSLRSLSLNVDRKTIDRYRVLIANNRAHLQNLRLDVGGYGTVQYPMHAFPSLKVLHVSGFQLENLTPVLRSCKGTIEEVWMKGKDTCWDPVFTELNVCRELSKIELTGGVQEREYVTLLESFGSKLKGAWLKEMSDESCEQLVRSCPNLTCSLVVREMKDVSRMDIFGNQVRSVSIVGMDLVDHGELKRVFQLCSGLTEIRYFESETHSTEEMAQSLFLTRRVHLENIDLRFYRLSISNLLLDAVRSTTGNVRFMDLTFGTFEDIDALVQLLKANRKLEVINISQMEMHVSVEDAADKTGKILGGLLGHCKLREIAISFELRFGKVRWGLDARFADACAPFRCRPVEVVICGKRYSDRTSLGVPVNPSMGATF